MSIFKNLEDKAIIDRIINANRKRPEVIEQEIRQIVSVSPKEDVIGKLNFLRNLYGNIVKEYDKLMNVLRRRAAADKRTIMKLTTPEELAAAQRLFGPNVKAITFDRYLDLLKLEKDLNMICVQNELEEGDILNAR